MSLEQALEFHGLPIKEYQAEAITPIAKSEQQFLLSKSS
jgi:hypothetical protein